MFVLFVVCFDRIVVMRWPGRSVITGAFNYKSPIFFEMEIEVQIVTLSMFVSSITYTKQQAGAPRAEGQAPLCRGNTESLPRQAGARQQRRTAAEAQRGAGAGEAAQDAAGVSLVCV